MPSGTSVRLSFRTGSSAIPDASWSPWSPAGSAVPSGNGWEVPIPAIGNGRYLQWQAEMAGEDGRSPRLQLAEVSYRQVNQRPRIDRFGALDPGQILVPANFNPADQAYEPAGPNRDGIFTTLAARGSGRRSAVEAALEARPADAALAGDRSQRRRPALHARRADRERRRRLAADGRRSERGLLRLRRHGAAGRALPVSPHRVGSPGQQPRRRRSPQSRRANRWSSTTRPRRAARSSSGMAPGASK